MMFDMIREKHGMATTRFYSIWQNMRRRCYDTTRHNFLYYGGRGIRVEWDTFNQFFTDMYPEYLKHSEKNGEKNTFIERINNNKNYSCENCRWSTRSEQVRNRRSNIYLTFNQKTQCLKDWSIETGINRLTIKKRLNNGWSVAQALTVNPAIYHKRNN